MATTKREASMNTSGIGIDLGTTKSCIALARRVGDGETVELVDLSGAPGCRGTVLPSALALVGNELVYGDEALAVRGRPGFKPESNVFYETKNLMGLRYTFRSKVDGVGGPTDVAALLLRRLWDLASARHELPANAPVVITVPASFQGAQRRATLAAARRAFTDAHEIRLLDEPCAAFLDAQQRTIGFRERSTLLVFDFGGGTCDVAIFEVAPRGAGETDAKLRATSRYHRLGGGDIDRAIVHDHLMPALLAASGIGALEVSWSEKRQHLEPQLLATAENLKLALSAQIERAAGTPAAGHCVAVAAPIQVLWRERALALRDPTLSEVELNKILVSFLDPDPAPDVGDEYVLRNSIFAPVIQALFRAGLTESDVDAVLLCGSSVLLPPVRAALAARFPGAELILGDRGAGLQGAIARGAARQALALATNGRPLVHPVCSGDLFLRVDDGLLPLARAGTPVPCASPASVALHPPCDSAQEAVTISVELVADGNRNAGRALWSLPPPVRRGERIELSWWLDENQCAELKLTRSANSDTDEFSQRFEAPVLHRDAGQQVRVRVLEREEAIRRGEIAGEALPRALEQHAQDCRALGEYEKALQMIRAAMQEGGSTNLRLNICGILRERLGDFAGAEANYRQASGFFAARFNLAFLQYQRGEHANALETIRALLADDEDRPSRVLMGNILAKLGRHDDARLAWQDALEGKIELARFDGFELSWMKTAAGRLSDEQRAAAIAHELASRERAVAIGERYGVLPRRAAT